MTEVQPGVGSLLSPGPELTSSTRTASDTLSASSCREFMKTYFDDFEEYLAVRLAQPSAPPRVRARNILTRLTGVQAFELSTDVYDELVRRKEGKLTHLLSRKEFHPKRNRARQKLSTLPHSRFEDLSSDVHFEILRRYPEFKKGSLEAGPTTANSDFAGRARLHLDDSAASNSNSNSQAQQRLQPEPGPPISASSFNDSDDEFSANAARTILIPGPTGFMQLDDADYSDRDEAEASVEKDRKLEASEARVGHLEEELAALRLHAEEQSRTINALREELDGLRGAQETGQRS